MTRVTAAVIERDGKILIAKRATEDQHKGKWEFPGGKIESGEGPRECLKRELSEELGIEAEIGDFICSSRYANRDIEVELFAYRASHLSGDIRPYVHDELKWVALDELLSYDFPEANGPIIKKLFADAAYKKP